MIQAQTQTPGYWEKKFSLTDSDIEQLYNYFLETEKPQTIERMTQVLVEHRVNEELKSLERTVKGRQLYRPDNDYEVGSELVFPALGFAQGTVTDIRPGFNPQEGQFDVATVDMNGKTREFVVSYSKPHLLSSDNEGGLIELLDIDTDRLYQTYGKQLAVKLREAIANHNDFVAIGALWFVKSLLVEINVGHLHLSEAVLEMNEGGPLGADEILPMLDLDPSVDPAVQAFSLNNALHNDARFDDVGGKNRISWYLQRLEPPEVQETPERLKYRPFDYDRSALTPQLRSLEVELDDEWSDLPAPDDAQAAVLSLTFPHRWAGTLPLSSRLRPMFASGKVPRQRIVLRDEETGQEIVSWVVLEGRYIHGLRTWFDQHEIPVGGYIHLSPTEDPGVLNIRHESRRAQREWVRLATAADNRIHFELKRRSIGCEYDDLLIVGTDVVAAIDALWRRAEANDRPIDSLLVELFSTLSELTPQHTVHAKTLYSAINMLRRMPPGPVFAELVNNPAFQTVGDHYWLFDQSRRQGG